MSNLCEQVNSIIGVNQLVEEGKLQLYKNYLLYTDFKYPVNKDNFKEQALTILLVRFDSFFNNLDDKENLIKMMVLSQKKLWSNAQFFNKKFITIREEHFIFNEDENVCSTKIWFTSFD